VPCIVFDTGFLYSLAVTRDLSKPLFERWASQGQELWIPGGVVDEVRTRIKHPISTLPPGLPRQTLGMIESNSNALIEIRLEPAELAEAYQLAELIRGPQVVPPAARTTRDDRDSGEAEAAVLIARRCPTATLASDDRRCLPVVMAYILKETKAIAPHFSSRSALRSLLAQNLVDQATAKRIEKALEANGRPRDQ
jgi:hypothetical protein